MNVSWTFLSRERDEYERLDYAISSSALIPEINFHLNQVIHSKKWEKGSTHRPISVSISCQDRSLWTKEKINSVFPNAIRTPEYIKTPPSIGEKRKKRLQVDIFTAAINAKPLYATFLLFFESTGNFLIDFFFQFFKLI